MVRVSTSVSKIGSWLGTCHSFQDMYDRKRNSFDFARFVLASSVIYYHSFALFYGVGKQGDVLVRLTRGQLDSGTFAVMSFFVISGFLVTQSLVNSSSYWSYLSKRALRIFPAFFVSLVLCAFVIGPAVSSLDLKSYFLTDQASGPISFVWKNLSFNILGYIWTIHDAFAGNPFPSSINGSMWTLKYEFACYLAIIILSCAYFFKHRALLLHLTAAVAILVILSYKFQFYPLHLTGSFWWWVLSDNEFPLFLKFSYYFLAGALVFVYREKIPFNLGIVLLAILGLVAATRFRLLSYALLFLLPYLMLAFCLRVRWPKFAKYGDFSYGIYIYAFPVQQTLVYALGGRSSLWTFVAASFTVTLLVAVLSWHFVEKPMLDLKAKLSGTTHNQGQAANRRSHPSSAATTLEVSKSDQGPFAAPSSESDHLAVERP